MTCKLTRVRVAAAAVALASFTLPTLTLCGCAGATAPAARLGQADIVDLSASFTQTDDLIADTIARQAVTVAETEGLLVVIPLGSDTQGNATPNLEFDFKVPSTVPDGDMYRDQWRRAQVGGVKAKVNDWLKAQNPGASDYQGSLNRAYRSLEGFDGRKVVTVIGDGFASTGSLRVITDQLLTADECRAIATEGLKTGRLPSLKGVTVNWVGGGRSPSQVLSPERQSGLQQCWGSLLTQLGADLPAGWWSSPTSRI